MYIQNNQPDIPVNYIKRNQAITYGIAIAFYIFINEFLLELSRRIPGAKHVDIR